MGENSPNLVTLDGSERRKCPGNDKTDELSYRVGVDLCEFFCTLQEGGVPFPGKKVDGSAK
jgi:hypothetical protein